MGDDNFQIDPNAGLIVKSGQYTFHASPPVVGYWVFPGSVKGYATKFASVCKPNWLHRKTMELLLGFKLEDNS
jgi:hypothetical protein